MQSDSALMLPWWLVVGILLGVGIGILVAGAFAVGMRLFPAETPDASASSTGESRKRVEIRRYLRAIGEEFSEDHEFDGRSVAFYLPDRNVAITFDARAYFRIGATDTVAVLVEHEMPGIHLGRRLPFETPDLAPVEDVESDVAAAFAVLGVPTDASETEIKAAYREKVKRVHPDQGGDREAFRRVREAYATADAHARNRTEADVGARSVSPSS